MRRGSKEVKKDNSREIWKQSHRRHCPFITHPHPPKNPTTNWIVHSVLHNWKRLVEIGWTEREIATYAQQPPRRLVPQTTLTRPVNTTRRTAPCAQSSVWKRRCLLACVQSSCCFAPPWPLASAPAAPEIVGPSAPELSSESAKKRGNRNIVNRVRVQ